MGYRAWLCVGNEKCMVVWYDRREQVRGAICGCGFVNGGVTATGDPLGSCWCVL